MSVRIYQGVIVANAFNFFMSAGQACLIPFLSLYFLYLDLNPLQTGLLLGLKAFTGALSTAFWTQCLTTTSRRLKFVLVFSLLILVTSHLVMVLMPSMKADKSDNFCPHPRTHFVPSRNCSGVDNDTSCLETSLSQNVIDQTDLTTNDVEISKTTLAVSNSENIPNYLTIFSQAMNVTKTPHPQNLSTNVIIISAKSPNISTTLNNFTASGFNILSHRDVTPDLIGANSDKSNHDFKKKKRHEGHEEINTTDKPIGTPESINPGDSKYDQHQESDRSNDELENRLQSIQNQVFSAMLVLVVVSEMFSSPCQQVADELYVSFLEYNDLPLSRRRSTGCWSLLGGSIMPWIIVSIIDQLPCHVPPSKSHRILFHFWVFTLVHFLSFLFSICYPSSSHIPPDIARGVSDNQLSSHTKRWANLARGLKLVASDGRTLLVSLTMIVVGFVQGVICTFLPWVIHGLITDGSEFYIGAAIGLSCAGDFLARMFGEWISRKVGHVVAILFGLLITATRLSLYGFILKPWMALIGESAHFFGAALVITAVTDHPAFRFTTKSIDGENGSNSKKRKHVRGYGSLASFAAAESMSISSALQIIRSGLGFSIGCCVAGILTDYYGMPMAFWVAGGISVGWCMVFVVLYPCCKSPCMIRGRTGRKKKNAGLASTLLAGRYKKLSKQEDEEDEEEEEEEDDDEDEDASTEEERVDWMKKRTS